MFFPLAFVASFKTAIFCFIRSTFLGLNLRELFIYPSSFSNPFASVLTLLMAFIRPELSPFNSIVMPLISAICYPPKYASISCCVARLLLGFFSSSACFSACSWRLLYSIQKSTSWPMVIFLIAV